MFPERPSTGTVCLVELRGTEILDPIAEVLLPAGKTNPEVGADSGKRVIPLVRAGDDRFVGLLGIDLDDPAGSWQLRWTWKEGVEERIQRMPLELQVVKKAYPVQTLKMPPNQVDLSAEDLARTERESAAVKKVLALRSPIEFLGAIVHPLKQRGIGDRFGSRRVINGQPKAQHSGADYKASTGTVIRAVAPGRVVLAGDHFFAGQSVYVDHGGGLITMSFHMSRIDVTEGQQVVSGETLGAVGATGRVTGPHLHFGVRLGGARVDPDSLLGLAEKIARSE